MISPSTYIGSRGYTIYKSALSLEDQRWVRSTLHVKPHVPGAPIQSTGFDVYRESNRKFYVPLAFGTKHFGAPDCDNLAKGQTIACKFQGKLREYQVPVVRSFLDLTSDIKGGIIDLPCGYGKTSCALYIASHLQKKVLVIVHKSFLMTQWEERIRQFLPTASIGRIQGEVFDVDGHDIVIGMLQSLSMKAYPDDAFSSFGTTIIDECHHIPSQVFSRALNKVVTRNILGLSATVERKDGLTKILHMFMGSVVYSKKREPEESVEVRKLTYDCRILSEQLKENTVDYRGNVKYSTIVSKICSYKPRTKLISKMIQAEISRLANQQLLVLSQQKDLLADLKEYLEIIDIDCGYYVGGMTVEALVKSSTQTVILATYSMASEGLDIKGLTTLFLVTPRTDIVQAVGRIMRSKHARPLIVDIVDPHPVLLRQWGKRLTYYRKNNYNVWQATSSLLPDDLDWEHLPIKKKKTTSHKCIL